MNKKLKQKAIIIIGGSEQQVPQIQWAKEFDMFVVVTDKNSDVPGKKIADLFEVIDGTDIQTFLKLAKKLQQDYDLVGVHSNNDFALPLISTVSEFLNSKNCSLKSTLTALDKYKAKELWQKNNLSTPSGKLVESYSEAKIIAMKIGLPIIIKPKNSSGSRGVKSVTDINELEIAFNEAQNYSKSILMEEFIQGSHVDINGLFLNGKFIRCGTSQKYFDDSKYHYPVWCHQPAVISKNNENSSYELVESAARILGIKSGPVKADLIITESGPVLLELSPRFHGDVLTTSTSVLSTGESPIKSWFAYLAGDKNPLRFIKSEKELAGWMAIYAFGQHGTIESINGIKNAKKIKNINDIFIWKKNGDELSFPKDTNSRVGFIWATGKNIEELNQVLLKANSMIKIRIKSENKSQKI